MAPHSTLQEGELREALIGLAEELEDRAKKAFSELGDEHPATIEAAHQFLAYTELIACYGGAMVALQDIEDEGLMN